MTANPPADRRLLDEALSELARTLPCTVLSRSSPIQAQVVRTFLRFGRWRVHAQRERTRDQVQSVWFENEARVLRAWDEGGGLGFAGWCGQHGEDLIRGQANPPPRGTVGS